MIEVQQSLVQEQIQINGIYLHRVQAITIFVQYLSE